MANPASLRPFKRNDPRINRHGRPKSFVAMRTLAQAIAHEVATRADGEPVTVDGHALTIVEAILRSWAQSKDARLQMAFVEIAYGKVPNTVHLAGDGRGAAIPITVVDYRIGIEQLAPLDGD